MDNFIPSNLEELDRKASEEALRNERHETWDDFRRWMNEEMWPMIGKAEAETIFQRHLDNMCRLLKSEGKFPPGLSKAKRDEWIEQFRVDSVQAQAQFLIELDSKATERLRKENKQYEKTLTRKERKERDAWVRQAVYPQGKPKKGCSLALSFATIGFGLIHLLAN